MGEKQCKAHVCSKIVGSRTPRDSIEVGKNSRKGKGSKGGFEGFVVELHDYG
jgi:hypothetical protein